MSTILVVLADGETYSLLEGAYIIPIGDEWDGHEEQFLKIVKDEPNGYWAYYKYLISDLIEDNIG